MKKALISILALGALAFQLLGGTSTPRTAVETKLESTPETVAKAEQPVTPPRAREPGGGIHPPASPAPASEPGWKAPSEYSESVRTLLHAQAQLGGLPVEIGERDFEQLREALARAPRGEDASATRARILLLLGADTNRSAARVQALREVALSELSDPADSDPGLALALFSSTAPSPEEMNAVLSQLRDRLPESDLGRREYRALEPFQSAPKDQGA